MSRYEQKYAARLKECAATYIPAVKDKWDLTITEKDLEQIPAVRIFLISGEDAGFDVMDNIRENLPAVAKRAADRELAERASAAVADAKARQEIADRVANLKPEEKMALARSMGSGKPVAPVLRDPTGAERAQLSSMTWRQALSFCRERGIKVS